MTTRLLQDSKAILCAVLEKVLNLRFEVQLEAHFLAKAFANLVAPTLDRGLHSGLSEVETEAGFQKELNLIVEYNDVEA